LKLKAKAEAKLLKEQEKEAAKALKLKEKEEAKAAKLKAKEEAKALKLKEKEEAKALKLKEKEEAKAAKLKAKEDAKAAKLKAKEDAKAVTEVKVAEVINELVEEDYENDVKESVDVRNWEHASRPGEKLFIDDNKNVFDQTEEHIGVYDPENDVIYEVESDSEDEDE
jgi:hypothetical protein